MGAVIPPAFMVGGQHQYTWDVIRVGGPVCPDFQFGVVGHNTPHSVGVGGPA